MKMINNDTVDIRTLTNNSLPWFRFYAKDWKNNSEVMTMSMNERGIYLTMLIAQWDNNNKLPANAFLIAKMCNTETRVITKFLAKWNHLFPVLHDVDGCECGASWSGVASELPVSCSGVASELDASSLHFCKQLANPKLCNIRIDIELQDLKRVDKTKRNDTKSNNTKTTSSGAFEKQKPEEEEVPDRFEDVQTVAEAFKALPFIQMPGFFSSGTESYKHINRFVNTPDWEVTLKAMIKEYSDSTLLQAGQMRSLNWLFDKDWATNVEEVISGKYAGNEP